MELQEWGRIISIQRVVALLFLASSLFGATAPMSNEIDVSKFSGLDTYDNPATLDPSQSQDLLNVNIQPGGTAVYKRDGYSQFAALGTGQAVHGGYHFQQSNGSDVQLWQNSTTVFSIINDTTTTGVFSTSPSASLDCTDSQGFAYCVTSAMDGTFKTDGTSAGTSQLTTPNGSVITASPTRLYIADVSGSASTIYASQSANFGNFVTGPLTTDPFAEIINSPGSHITHIAYYFGRIFWWKDQSFGYMTGDDQFSLAITIVSNSVGTLDNSSAFWNAAAYNQEVSGTPSSSLAGSVQGGIFFRGQDNHFYVYDGFNLTRLSRPITPTITAANKRKQSSWTQTTNADFMTGSSTNIAISNNSISLSTFSAGTIADQSFENVSHPDYAWVNNVTLYSTFATGQAPACSLAPQSGSAFMVLGNANAGINSCVTDVRVNILDTSGNILDAKPLTSTLNSCAWTSDTFTSAANASKQVKFQFSLTENNCIGGPSVVNTVTTQANYLFNGSLSYYYTCKAQAPSSTICFFDTVSGGVEAYNTSGEYSSPVFNAPAITTWANFQATANTSVGTQTFSVRSSNTPFLAGDASPSWVTQTNGSQVASPVGSYMQFKDDLTTPSNATASPSLSDFTLNWYEGVASDKSYITYFNDAIWFEVSAGTSTSTNNETLVYDLLNNAWLVYDIAANGFLIENGTLYFGDSGNSFVYKYGGATSDRGVPISSHWKSKDFSGNDPFVQNEYVQSDFAFNSVASTVTYTFTLDENTSTSSSIYLGAGNAKLANKGQLLPNGKIGKFYSFTVGDSSTNPAWTLLAHRVKYNPLNWIPMR